jgi:hypothetical protein
MSNHGDAAEMLDFAGQCGDLLGLLAGDCPGLTGRVPANMARSA